jgi:phosphatidylserine/phosphatidylglycerophosphate/cardiolipin synthase-like enzyme
MFCGVCERSILIHRFANHLLEALRSGSPLSVPCDAMRSASEQVRAPSLKKIFHLSNEPLPVITKTYFKNYQWLSVLELGIQIPRELQIQ